MLDRSIRILALKVVDLFVNRVIRLALRCAANSAAWWSRHTAVWLCALALVLGMQTAGAQNLQQAPVLTSPVVDAAGMLSAAEAQALRSKLMAFEKEKGTQIAVLIVKTTKPEDIFSYTNRVANTYKLGRNKVGDGILLVVAQGDRRMRIAVAKTLEGAVPDVMAKRIIDQYISPAFKRGQFYQGLDAGAGALIKRVRGEPLPAPNAQRGGSGASQGGSILGGDWLFWLFFTIVFLPGIVAVLKSIFGRFFGSALVGAGAGAVAWFAAAPMLIAGGVGVGFFVYALLLGKSRLSSVRRRDHGGSSPWIITHGGGGGGWGGGLGGGGWSSGGGGDFGGGGASGGW